MNPFCRNTAVGRLTLLLMVLAVPSCLIVPHASAAEPKALSTKSCNLRPFFDESGLTPRSQGKRGTCSVFTVAAAVEYALAKKQVNHGRASVEFLNWASNQVAKNKRDGSFFSHLCKGLSKYGVCTERDMPYQKKFDAENQPSQEALHRAAQIRKVGLQSQWIKRWNPKRGLNEREFAKVKRVLQSGWPVCGGFLWPKKGLESYDKGVLKMLPRDKVFDGHSVLLVGYRDDPTQPGGGVFLLRNSGGHRRDGEMPYEYAKAYMNDAVWIGSGSEQSNRKQDRMTP